MASFSRLQLAAALIEYDNDSSDPTIPIRSAHESAIFAHLRRIPPLPPQRRKSVDYLGVELPGDNGTDQRVESVEEPAATMSMVDTLRNPFGRNTIVSDVAIGEDEDEMEVDLASWGLSSLVPKEKDGSGKKGKGKEKVTALPNPHASTQASSYRSTRSMSMGNIDAFGAGGAFLDSESAATPEMRRRSLGSALELGDYKSYRPPPRQRPSSAHDAIDRIPAAPPLHFIPFPSQSVRSASPGPNDGPIGQSRDRRSSFASMGSRDLLAEIEEKPNPFALDPPPLSQASRFDPKARGRSMSVGTMGSAGLLTEDFHERPFSPSSRLDPNHARTFSNASMLRDNDGASIASGMPARGRTIRERPYSTLELMRPKVLVMPSPLQGQNVVAPSAVAREGFEISADGPPLPHGSRPLPDRLSSGGLLGNASGSTAPIASNSFTPNPRASLTLSQLTFRNTLMVAGQRDVAYHDLESGVRRATEDGEQVTENLPEEEPARPVTVVIEEPEGTGRPPGKLYGRSLVDELEKRKAIMRSKQRVFTGDDRPSMMARGQSHRPSTFIDPSSLNQRPVSQNILKGPESRPNLSRNGSFGGKPLLNFDEDRSPGLQTSPNDGRSGARSVFGVDTLWQREMAKLEEIEAQEAEERKRQEAAEAAQLEKRSKKKKKGKEKVIQAVAPVEEPRAVAEAPVPPVIRRPIVRTVPPPPGDDETESSSESTDAGVPRPPRPRTSADGWHSGESDKEPHGPVRTTGVGPRYPKRGPRRALSIQSGIQPADDDDSEEDMPLAATVDRAVQRVTRLGLSAADSSDSDEEKPLSQLLTKSKYMEASQHIGSEASATPGRVDAGDDEEDEDDKPLGLRVSRFMSSQSQFGNPDDGDDDDLPLGLHPEQQRRTQYNMFLQQQQLQQQQQQQQLLLQAQMQQSMMFSTPSLIGSTFFGPPVIPPMMPMMPPPAPASPPPGAPDMAKFGRVDRWRHEIAGGQP